jgi:hypothetical protein
LLAVGEGIMAIIVPDGVTVAVGTAVSGLLIKEGFNVVKWLKMRKSGNGKALANLLSDIKGQGAVMIGLATKAKEEIGEVKTTVAVLATRVGAFEEAYAQLDKRICLGEERLFNHIKEGG